MECRKGVSTLTVSLTFFSWVMTRPHAAPPYTPLPNEHTLYTSSPRVALMLATPAHYPGKQQPPFSLSSSSGVLHLTNQRIIFLPDKPIPQLESFASPILNLHDSRVTAPWFGPNVWTALLQPTPGGGIPVPTGGVVEVKMTFKEGGAFDFQTNYERVRERLQQVLEVARIEGNASGASAAPLTGVDVSRVDLEELPTYQERGEGPLIPPILSHQPQPPSPQLLSGLAQVNGAAAKSEPSQTPSEPPPSYEEMVAVPGETRVRRHEPNHRS